MRHPSFSTPREGLPRRRKSPFYEFRDGRYRFKIRKAAPVGHILPHEGASTILCLPDDILSHVLRYCDTRSLCQTRLVNKRLARLGLPLAVRTLVLRTPEALADLASAPLSPIYSDTLGKNVKCFELGFLPHNFKLGYPDIAIICPNLELVRFRFSLGIRIKADHCNVASLSGDTLFRATRPVSDASWLRFLSRFKPKRFEWISTDNSDLRLVGLYHELRALFRSWTNLTSIYLDGICLVDQHDMQKWRIPLPAERVHIRGPFFQSPAFLSQCAVKIKGSRICQILVLEAPTSHHFAEEATKEIPVISFGNTMIMLQGWSRADRQNFKASMTGKPLPHPMGPVQYKPHYTKKSLIKHALNRLILLGFSGLVLTFALILILAVPVLRDVACPQETAKLPLFTLPAHTPGPTQSKPSNRPASSSTDIQIPPTVPTNSLSTPTLDIVLEPSTRSTTYGEVIDQLVTGLLGDTWPLYQRKASKSDRPSSTALVSAARIEHASTPCPSMFSLIATSLPKPSRPIPSQDMITYSTTTSLKALRGFCSCFIAWFRSVWAATAHYAASQNLFTIGDGSTSHSAPFLLQRTSL